MKKVKKALLALGLAAAFLSVNVGPELLNPSVAEAGPCARAGCDDKPHECGYSYDVFHIGQFRLERFCTGTPLGS